MEREKDILKKYIDDVLYHPENADMDLAVLDEEYRSLGEKICQLGEWAMEADLYAGKVAKGQLYGMTLPDEENVFAKNIREIHRTLQNMTRQIEQLFDRDTVNDSEKETLKHCDFNYMVKELQKRASALENERNLFVRFTESASERIVVLDEETGEMLFGNRVARKFREETMEYVDSADVLNARSGCTSGKPYQQWMHTVIHPNEKGELIEENFQVHSLYIIWENRGAIAHMFSNVTEMQKIQKMAVRDSLTGAYNRSYAMEYMKQMYTEEKKFTVAFVDVDYLKYCNDTFGHNSGDRYLLQVVKILQGLGHGETVCRTGGDEFLVISETLTEDALARSLEDARQRLCGEYFDESHNIHKSFSYGLAACSGDRSVSLSKLLSDADERMYQNKLENKKKNHLSVRDERLV